MYAVGENYGQETKRPKIQVSSMKSWWQKEDQFRSVQSLSRVQLFATPWTAARQASLSITNSRSLLRLMSIESVMPSNHIILCRPLLHPPSTIPSIRGFSNESVLRIRWPKYWSFRFSISPSKEYSGLILFRVFCLDSVELVGCAYQYFSPNLLSFWTPFVQIFFLSFSLPLLLVTHMLVHIMVPCISLRFCSFNFILTIFYLSLRIISIEQFLSLNILNSVCSNLLVGLIMNFSSCMW